MTGPTRQADRTASDDGDVGSDTAERFAREHPGLVKLGRAGWVAKGAVYALTGVLAVVVALDTAARGGSTGEEANQSGAVAAIARQSGGAVLLLVIAAGLLLYAAWRFVTVLLPADNDVSAWLARAGYAVSVGTYALLAWTAVSFARRPGSSESDEDAQVERLTRDLLGSDLGRIAVLAGGAVLVVLAVVFVWRGISAGFTSQLAPGSVGPLSHDALVAIGRVGWVGRGLMVGLIGYFVVRAAVTFDADDAQGLDGSLRKASETSLGTALVFAVAVGLIAYGLFCVLSAPRRRLVGAD